VKIEAHSRKDYFDAAGERGPALRQLDKIIRQAAPTLKPYFLDAETMAGLGLWQVPLQICQRQRERLVRDRSCHAEEPFLPIHLYCSRREVSCRDLPRPPRQSELRQKLHTIQET